MFNYFDQRCVYTTQPKEAVDWYQQICLSINEQKIVISPLYSNNQVSLYYKFGQLEYITKWKNNLEEKEIFFKNWLDYSNIPLELRNCSYETLEVRGELYLSPLGELLFHFHEVGLFDGPKEIFNYANLEYELSSLGLPGANFYFASNIFQVAQAINLKQRKNRLTKTNPAKFLTLKANWFNPSKKVGTDRVVIIKL